jgi:PAS domain S-box-containing protein
MLGKVLSSSIGTEQSHLVRKRPWLDASGILRFGLVLTSAVIVVLCYLLWGMYVSLVEVTQEEMRNQVLAADIAHLNEALTMSARMAAETGNATWEKLYREKERQLDEAITQSALLSRTEYEQNYAARTKAAYSRLIEMEDLAFSLVKAGRDEEALRLLSGDGYKSTKETYSEGLKEMVQAVRQRISETLASFRRRSSWVSAMAVLSLLVLYAGWIGVSILMRSHLERRRLAEQALAQEKEHLSVTLRSIGDGVITTDTEGRVVLMNEAAENLTGTSLETALGNPLASIISLGEGQPGSLWGHPSSIEMNRERSEAASRHASLIAPDGVERTISYSSAPIRDAQGVTVGGVFVFRDITLQRQLEEEILKAQKLESVGILAGGIAHDFNNILTAVIGNLYLARMAAAKGRDVVPKIQEAEKAAQRASKLTKQLLTFAKGGAPVKEVACLAGPLKEWVPFALSGSNVKCEFSIEPGLWAVDIDVGQIERVVHNLVINAQQAMPDGGRIVVSASNVSLEGCHALPLADGSYVKLTIQDFGCGIPDGLLGKIFDPYFSTKAHGSGLGLAASYAVVNHHNGLIQVHSKVGEGSTFDIYLPATREKPQKAAISLERLARGKGRVLVMDDDATVRDLAAGLLSEMGYSVHLCEDGQEAVEMYRRHLSNGDRFDVVIMDLTIPGGMGGKEAMERLLQMDPGVKAVVSSGYSDDPVMANHKDYGFAGVLRKPYGAVAMSVVMRNIISGRSNSPQCQGLAVSAGGSV